MHKTQGLPDTPFGSRFRQAFGGATDSDIARKLKKTPSDVGKWTKRGILPRAEILLDVERITKCNLHWLLIGEGEADLNPLRFLDHRTRAIVQRLATDEKKPIENVLSDLIREALMKRGSDLFLIGEGRLRGRQLDQLKMLVELAAEDDKSRPEEKAG